MKRLIIAVVLSLVFTSIPVQGAETTDTVHTIVTDYSRLRASNIVSSSTWIFDQSICSFSLAFNYKCTGSGTAILQKKTSGVWQDYSYTSKFSFTNTWSATGGITVSSLPSGTYRMKYYVSVGSSPETLFSQEQSI